MRVYLPWGRWEIVFQNIAAFGLLFGIWRGSIFYAVRTQILRMCYKIITNIASLTSLGLQELLSLVQWLPVNFRIDYSITSSVLWRSKVSFGCLMIPLVQNCRSCLWCMAFFFFFPLPFKKDSSSPPPLNDISMFRTSAEMLWRIYWGNCPTLQIFAVSCWRNKSHLFVTLKFCNFFLFTFDFDPFLGNEQPGLKENEKNLFFIAALPNCSYGLCWSATPNELE